ncbi:MAG: FtsX-like permease family protein [Nitrospirae bacterium]|nr:FtsX-like permease family protein [Nitrospirota bacterium]
MKRLSVFGLALKNLRRRPFRSLILLLTVSLVTGTLLSATIFLTGMNNALKAGTNRLGADILVVPERNESQARSALLSGEPAGFYMDRAIYEKIKKIEGVKMSSCQLFLRPTPFSCCYDVDTFLVAIDPATDFTVTPWLTKNLKKNLAGNDVLAGSDLPVTAGDTIPFFGTLFTVAGTMEPTGMKFFDQTVFMTMDAAYAMAEDSVTKSKQPLTLEQNIISAVLVRIQDGITPERVAIKIEYEIKGVRAIPAVEIVSSVKKQLKGVFRGMLAIGSVLWVLTLFTTGFAFSLIVNERKKEIGILRAMGAKKRDIFGLIITEAALISLAGGLAGIGTGYIFLLAFKNILVESFKMVYLFPSLPAIGAIMTASLALSLLTGLSAALIPASRASAMEPFSAIREGE